MASDYRTLNPKASQETLISLLQLDPSPIDNASLYDKDLPPLPEEAQDSGSYDSKRTPTGSTSTLGLSEPFLLMARELYQTPLTEPLLVALPVVAHVTSGIAIRLLRRRQNIKRYGSETPGMWALHHSKSSNQKHTIKIWPPLTYISVSGYVFVGLLASHVGMNRILPLVVDGDSSNIGLQFVSHGFARHPLPPWIAYSLLLSVGVGHMVWGWAKWLNLTPPANWKKITVDRQLRKTRRRAWWGIQAVTVALAALWAAGGLGIVARAGPAEGWLATVYDNIYIAVGH
ncbi:hypothetical protein Daesc_001337 [Daldinia eschscholtzii]|uniref:Mitochondrial adapter protein MCP1 transmembrane domain-containing protein n=1 Tax=Daldinia eschscholtzii TaxID=292717 RepID=A0AAX6MUJ3_9PEZI